MGRARHDRGEKALAMVVVALIGACGTVAAAAVTALAARAGDDRDAKHQAREAGWERERLRREAEWERDLLRREAERQREGLRRAAEAGLDPRRREETEHRRPAQPPEDVPAPPPPVRPEGKLPPLRFGGGHALHSPQQQAVREEEAPAAPPSAKPQGFEVEVTVALENIKLRDCYRPLLARSEQVEVVVAGKTLSLEVRAGADSEATGTLRLPAGIHRYTLSAEARTLRYPGNGAHPFALLVKGKGAGNITVRENSRFVLKRGQCEGARYSARLEELP